MAFLGFERTFKAPKSVCMCGHSGDGPDSDHRNTFQKGHGSCTKCACDKFTWVSWTDIFKAFLKKHKK